MTKFDIITRKTQFWAPAIYLENLDLDLFKAWLLRGIASSEISEAIKKQSLDSARRAEMNWEHVALAVTEGLIPMWGYIVETRERLRPIVCKYDEANRLIWFIFPSNVDPVRLEAWLSAFHWGMRNADKAVDIYEALTEYGIWRNGDMSEALDPDLVENVARVQKSNFGYPLGDLTSSPTIERAYAGSAIITK
jgi:hypothetical protein